MIRIFLLCLISLLSSPGLLLARDVFFYHNDNTGTPVAMTDNSGKVVWRAHDKPFGEEFQTTEAPEHNSRRFIGKEKDKETGLVYIGARYLDPASGRFLQPDPVGPVDPMTGKVNVEMLTNPQRLNRYVYGLNNPYRYIDPDGKMSRDIENGINPFEMTEGYAPRGGGGISSGSSGARGTVASKGTPSLDSLSKAAGAGDKGGFTKAGRSLQKHGSRPGSKWSQSDINVNSPKQANYRAQDLVDDVLTAPGSKVQPNPRGGWDAIAPDGRTIRYNRDGTMQGLRE